MKLAVVRKYAWVALLLVIVIPWITFARNSHKKELDQKISAHEQNDNAEEAAKCRTQLAELEQDRVFKALTLAVISTGAVVALFVFYGLPFLAERLAVGVYGSGAQLEADPLRDARALVAAGEYEAALAAYRTAAAKDPENILPIKEIAMLQRDHLTGPYGAISTYTEALQNHARPIDDAAFLLFRLAELYREIGEIGSAAATLHQVIEQLPDTRHSANARSELRDWGMA